MSERRKKKMTEKLKINSVLPARNLRACTGGGNMPGDCIGYKIQGTSQKHVLQTPVVRSRLPTSRLDDEPSESVASYYKCLFERNFVVRIFV